MIKIPPNNQWFQNNRSDILGTILASWNLDLNSNKGKLRVSPRGVTNPSAVGLTDFNGAPVAFRFFTRTEVGSSARWWMLAGDNIFRMNNLYLDGTWEANNLTFTGTAPAGFDHTVGDMITYNGGLWFTTLRDIGRIGASGNATVPYGDNPLSQTYSHVMETYGNRMYVTDENTKIFSGDGSTLTTTGSNSLNIATDGVDNNKIITCLRASSSGIWILTINQVGEQGKIFFWDGAQTTPNSEYILESTGTLAGVIYHDVLYVVTDDGRILSFNGGTFTEQARFPVDLRKPLKNSLSSVNDRWIHPNGMMVIDDEIEMLICGEYEDGTFDERLPSGRWRFNPSSGNLYHTGSIGLTDNNDASIKDYGQNRLSEVGALWNSKYYSRTTENGNILIGGSYYTNASTSSPFVAYDDSNDTLQKYGYFVTDKIYSSELQDTWQKLWSRHKKLLASTDSITVKYRTDEADPTNITITWVDTNTFTTTTNVLGREGDEVEILQGDGAGKCAHISSIDVSSGTYTVNLDDTFTGVTTNTAKARVQSWKKAGTFTSQNVNLTSFTIGKASTWIQLKVCMQFTGKNEVDDLILINSTHQVAQ